MGANVITLQNVVATAIYAQKIVVALFSEKLCNALIPIFGRNWPFQIFQEKNQI
jgi:hypothetical protein